MKSRIITYLISSLIFCSMVNLAFAKYQCETPSAAEQVPILNYFNQNYKIVNNDNPVSDCKFIDTGIISGKPVYHYEYDYNGDKKYLYCTIRTNECFPSSS